MPADHQAAAAAAAALSLPPSPPASSSGDADPPFRPTDPLPPWTPPARSPSAARRLHRRPPHRRRRRRRRSSALALVAAQQPLHRQLLGGALAVSTSTLAWFRAQPLPRRVGVLLLLGVLGALALLGLVFSHRIFAALLPLAAAWRALPGGWALAWACVFATAFPPLFGYSASVTTAGFVFGFPAGWAVAATASTAGAAAAFVSSRTVFAGYVDRLVGEDKRFVALGQVLRRDGLGVLAMIRFCPLPFSLSNGFLATVPNIGVWAFTVATALAR